VQQVRRQEHRAAAVGVLAEQAAHPVDARRVETVGGLVEHEDLRLPQEGVRDAEPLPHAERVVADAPARLLVGQADEREHLVDAARGQPHGARADREDLPARAAGVLRRGVEEDADLRAGVGDVAVAHPADGRRTLRRGRQSGDDAHRRRLAGTVRPEEAGHGAGTAREADVVDGREAGVRLREVLDLDHGPTLADVDPAAHPSRSHDRRAESMRRPGPSVMVGRPPAWVACRR
jgi:hypothetical protein